MKAARLETEEVSDPDRISHLPHDLLFRIFQLIPVSDAMATSLLSKRWRSLWKTMSTLDYDQNSFPNTGSLRFDQFCSRSLQLHEGPILKTLTLKLMEKFNDIDSLIFSSIRSTVFEITITATFYPCYYSTISFPKNLGVFQTLVVLKLQSHIHLDLVDSPVCFQSLKKLFLKCVRFECEQSFCKFISACPVLEDLIIQRLSSVGHFMFSISVPSLQRLSLLREGAYYHNDDARFDIITPSLENLNIFDRVASYNFIEDMPKLVEADIRVDLSKNGKLLKVLTSVGNLFLGLYPLMVFDSADRLISSRLLHLKLDIYDNFQSNLLMCLLNGFPNLKALKLNHRHVSYTIMDQPYSVFELSSVPECLSSGLETLRWIGYAGIHEEREALAYILKNALCLTSATISLHSTTEMENNLLIKELKSMSKASTLRQLFIKS